MKFTNTLPYLVLVLLALVGFTAINQDRYTAFSTSDENTYKVYALQLPDSLYFAGEPTPLKAPDIRERLDKELLVNTYWQSNMMLLLKRANKYFPTLERILEEEGVPDDFKYLAVIESALENVRSPKGAKGFWQIMPGTQRIRLRSEFQCR